MLAIPLDIRTLIIVVLAALALLLTIFAPQTMANLIGEPISLLGRLLGTIADWLQKGAERLVALVKSVFMIGHPVAKESATASTALGPETLTSASNYQATIREHPPAYAGVPSQNRGSLDIRSGPYDQLAPYEPATAPSLTPYPSPYPSQNGGSSSSGYAGAPAQTGDRVYRDPAYDGYGANGTTGTNGSGSSSQAIQPAQPAAPNAVSPHGVYSGVPSGRGTSAVSGSSAPAAADRTEAPTEELHATWVGEVIIAHVLYLVAGVIIVVSDFVFTVLRLQAVLFPDLPISPQLSTLSDLSGALFVSMVFLTGALTLDFLGVLPPPARLFPTMDEQKRRLFLAISLGAFLLNMVVVAVLFFAGQTLISYASTWPLGSLIIATLIGVLQVLVMFLAAWGAIRGLSALLALALGVVGILFELFALLLTWSHEALRTVGEHLVPDLIFGVAGIFRPNPEHAPRPAPTTANVLSVVGYGNTSSDFMAQLSADITQLYSRSSLIAAGAYAEDYHTLDDVRRRLNRLAITNITTSGQEGTPLQTLRDNIIRAYHKRGDVQTTLLWVVDGEKLAECLEVFPDLKRTLGNVNITVVCFLPQHVRDRQPYRELLRLSSPEEQEGNPPVTLTVLIDRRSPLYRAHGDHHHAKVLARGLAGMTLAPIHNAANQSFLTIIQNLNAAGYHFAALAVDSTGLVAARPQRGMLSWWRPEEQGEVIWQDALTKMEDKTQEMVEEGVGSSIMSKPDPRRVPVYVSYLAPLPARSHDYAQFKSAMSKWLANTYNIEALSVVQGSGADLSASKPKERGDRHGQTTILYGIPDTELGPLFSDQEITRDTQLKRV
jgi:hypothetical protein